MTESTRWSPTELERIGADDELRIAASRRESSLGQWVPVWVVRVGDDLYVRSYHGRSSSWFGHAISSRRGRIQAGGIARDVRFAGPDNTLIEATDQAYRDKYGRCNRAYLDPMISAQAAAATLRLVPITRRTGEQP